ncbi:MAG: ArsC family reductase [Gammaproteobacteria bacterium]
MAEVTTLYGIANCDTIKKARAWLANREIEFQFHDYRKQGLDIELLNAWVDELGWEALVNRRGTTWRQLAAEVRDSLDTKSAIEIMLDKPAIIKRPLLVKNGQSYLGFSDEQYSSIF